MIPHWRDINTIVFDFDGIFTDNNVYIDQYGIESVRCNRSDSLGLNLLEDFKNKNNWELDYFILSTESNSVVKERSKKLKIKCYNGVDNKLDFLTNYFKSPLSDDLFFNGVIYLGNDVNDLDIMKRVEYSVAPNDAHSSIISISKIVLNKNGGNGFVREFIDLLINE